MIRIEVETRFDVSLQDGFDYITNMDNWPRYWPGLVRIEPDSRWHEPGDQARLMLRLLGRPVELEMTLRQFVPYRLVEYTSVQRGLPDARHERHFQGVDGRLGYRIVVSYEPRAGWRGILDRVVVRRAIERAMRQTIANLERSFSDG
jgi:Polyketide cyclase / dehydrase and lipid transport